MKTYYLIAETHPTRGQLCVFGPRNYFPDWPLHDINPDRCYKSEKAALNCAAKLYHGYNSYHVIQVPEDVLTIADCAPVPEGLTREDILQYAGSNGNKSAACLLLLTGPDGFAGDLDSYNSLMAELKAGY